MLRGVLEGGVPEDPKLEGLFEFGIMPLVLLHLQTSIETTFGTSDPITNANLILQIRFLRPSRNRKVDIFDWKNPTPQEMAYIQVVYFFKLDF